MTYKFDVLHNNSGHGVIDPHFKVLFGAYPFGWAEAGSSSSPISTYYAKHLHDYTGKGLFCFQSVRMRGKNRRSCLLVSYEWSIVSQKPCIYTHVSVLLGWLSGREAEYMETLSDEQVTKDVIRTLKQFLKRQDRELPKLRRLIRWQTGSCWPPSLPGFANAGNKNVNWKTVSKAAV